MEHNKWNHLLGHRQQILIVKMLNNHQTCGVVLINKTNKNPLLSRFLTKMVSNHRFSLLFLKRLRIKPIYGSPQPNLLLFNKLILNKHPLQLFRLLSSSLKSSNGRLLHNRANKTSKILSNRIILSNLVQTSGTTLSHRVRTSGTTKTKVSSKIISKKGKLVAIILISTMRTMVWSTVNVPENSSRFHVDTRFAWSQWKLI